MDLREFLQAVVTCPVPGYFLIALAPKSGPGWWEEYFHWPDDLEKILKFALDKAEENNVYFSSYLFREPQSIKGNVLPSRTIQADLDEADIITLPLQPSILVRTSTGRHQGYWIIKEKWSGTGDDKVLVPPLDPEAHQVLSRKLTYAIPQCDTTGWPLGRRVRVPFTINHKYSEGPQFIEIAQSSLRQFDEAELELLNDPPNFLVTPEDVEFLDNLTDEPTTLAESISKGPRELFASIEKKLPAVVRAQYGIRAEDRSRALWALLCAAFRAGLSREEVWYLAWHSANNKFADLQYHAERELAKDVLRAEAIVKARIPDTKAEIEEVRKQQGSQHEKRQQIAQLVIQSMRAQGEFIHCEDDTCWYIRSDIGRPIRCDTAHSEWMDMILELQYGLNNTETDKQYVSYAIANFTKNIPVNGTKATLSHYDSDTNTLLLHTGHKDVIQITPTSIQRVPDGAFGVVFPWDLSMEAFTPIFSTIPGGEDWGNILFASALDNVITVAPEDALALLKVWFIFLLFKDAAISRPILAFFGQPGAGKSTLFRRIYRLLYGRHRAVEGVVNMDTFDQAVSSQPFVAFDNVDTPDKWLPDRLAISASPSMFSKRKLYTDADNWVVKRSALLGITAHNPHFNREDVADRLLLLTFQRLTKFLPEGDILASIYNQRNKLWGQVVLDCQRVLQTPMPNYADVPQFRVEDFARTGYWIATALGCSEQFRSALQTIGRSQKNLNLEEDQILVATIQTYLAKGKGGKWQTVGGLWNDLGLLAADPHAFQRIYRNAIHLGKKFWALQDSLKEIFDVEWTFDPSKGARVWKISPQAVTLEHLNGHTNGASLDQQQVESSNGIPSSSGVGIDTGRNSS